MDASITVSLNVTSQFAVPYNGAGGSLNQVQNQEIQVSQWVSLKVESKGRVHSTAFLLYLGSLFSEKCVGLLYL